MNTTEKYWSILQNVSDYLKYSETKATVIITVYSVLLTIIYTNPNEVFNAVNANNWVIFFTVLASLTSLLSIYFAFKCINPRLKNDNPHSVIYFGHIQEQHKDFESYYNASKDIISNEVSFDKQIAEQIHVNSNIAWKKFKDVTWSIRFFVASMLFVIILLMIYLI